MGHRRSCPVGTYLREPTKPQKAAAAPPRQATAPTLTAAEPATPKIQEKLTPKADPVEVLIARVEKEFQSGQASYQAGHLEQAKSSFDRAFNVLLSYPAGVVATSVWKTNSTRS